MIALLDYGSGNLRSVQKALLKVGADVRIARDGLEALEIFGIYRPSVVLLDIGMPGMNGYEVARVMRTQFTDNPAVLVALTGWGQDDDRARARAAGFDHHLVKPADIDALQRLLATFEQRSTGGVGQSTLLTAG